MTLNGPGSEERAEPFAAAVSPKFIVSIHLAAGPQDRAELQVRDARTGRVLDREIAQQKGTAAFGSVTAAGDGRTFFVSVLNRMRCGGEIRRLKIDESGAIREFAPVTNGKVTRREILSLAVSSSGTRLAFVERPCIAGQRAPTFKNSKISVLSVATGERRDWVSAAELELSEPSWTADGRTIGFRTYKMPARRSARPHIELRALDTTAPGGDLLSASRVVMVPTAQWGDVNGMMLAPDGRTVLAVVAQSRFATAPSSMGTMAAYALIRATVGRSDAEVLKVWRTDQPVDGLLAVDRSGRHLLVRGPGRFERIDDGKVSELVEEPGKRTDVATW